jgi:prephenate dehydrogenase
LSQFITSNLAILSPGLLGGSIAFAARRYLGANLSLRVWSRGDAALVKVRDSGVADVATTNLREVITGADLVILAMPVPYMKEMVQALLPHLSAGSLVTDVGSVKGPVVATLGPLCADAGRVFVGSHPMAGDDKAGFEAARGDLFDGKTCILTPTSDSPADDVDRLRCFWRSLSCRVLCMDADEHDRKVARISHLPHAVAAAVSLAALADDPSAGDCVGQGFRDSTRVAQGPADMWADILLENRAEVLASLTDATARLQELLAFVQGADKEGLRQFLAHAAQLRASLPGLPL